MPLRLSKIDLWKRHEERVCEVIVEALIPLQKRIHLIQNEDALNRELLFCLREANIQITDVDYITISRDPSANLHKKIVHSVKNLVSVKALKDRLANSRKVVSTKGELAKIFNISELGL